MNYELRVFVWNAGRDEIDDLASALADVLAERKLGVPDDGDDAHLRSMIVVKHAGQRMELRGTKEAAKFLDAVGREAYMIVMPGAEPSSVRISKG